MAIITKNGIKFKEGSTCDKIYTEHFLNKKELWENKLLGRTLYLQRKHGWNIFLSHPYEKLNSGIKTKREALRLLKQYLEAEY